ncbi:MAG: T9SS type A sorting domain-containing protein, partial [Bacteroidota bacterium]
DYVLIVSLRRDTAAQPARFEAYLNGTAIGLDRNVDVLGKVNESGGLGRVRGSTRFADGSTATNPAFVFFRGFIFEFSHYTGSLVSYKAEELTNQLTAEYGIAPITDAPVLASATTAPTTPVLGAAYPNPFVQQALVPLTLVEAADVTLAVYDALGRQVALLADGAHEAGAHTFALDAASLASGVYFVRALVAPASGVSEVLTQRISVVK